MKKLTKWFKNEDNLLTTLFLRDLFWSALGLGLCYIYLVTIYEAPVGRPIMALFLGAFLILAFLMWKIGKGAIGPIALLAATIFVIAGLLVGPSVPHFPHESLATHRGFLLGIIMTPIVVLLKAYQRKFGKENGEDWVL